MISAKIINIKPEIASSTRYARLLAMTEKNGMSLRANDLYVGARRAQAEVSEAIPVLQRIC